MAAIAPAEPQGLEVPPPSRAERSREDPTPGSERPPFQQFPLSVLAGRARQEFAPLGGE